MCTYDHQTYMLLQEIVPYNMKHNGETDACDLLMEINKLDLLDQFVDKTTYSRVCLYLTRFVDHFSGTLGFSVVNVCASQLRPVHARSGKYYSTQGNDKDIWKVRSVRRSYASRTATQRHERYNRDISLLQGSVSDFICLR